MIDPYAYFQAEQEAAFRQRLGDELYEDLGRRSRMEAYKDPNHPFNSSKYHTGKACITVGCSRPAGTKWGAYWCQVCNAKRLDSINESFRALIGKKAQDGPPST